MRVPPAEPDSDIGVAVVRQAWRHVSFLHWRYDPDVLASFLPLGLTLDQYGGSAWLSLVPFQMAGIRMAGMPAVAGVSTFPETNLRTYVVDARGRQGIWFFSLDAGSRWLTLAARWLLGAPYVHGDLLIDRADGVRYAGHRRSARDIGYDVHVRPAGARTPHELDGWLTNRWRAFTFHRGRLWEVPVRHEPWVLLDADLVSAQESLVAAAGLPAPTEPALVHHSRGVDDVAFGLMRVVSA